MGILPNGTYKKLKYFDKIELYNPNEIIIPQNDFCIFSSYEEIKIPNKVCAEMVDISIRMGEFRSHYAGFFDPGFIGNIVFEIINFGPPFSRYHKQDIAGFKFYPMKEYPEKIYNGSYQSQRGPRLANCFK